MAMFHRSTFKPLIALLSVVALTGCVTETVKLTDASGKVHLVPKMPESEKTLGDMEMPQGAGVCKLPKSLPIGEPLTEKAVIRLTRFSMSTDTRVIFPGDPVTKDRRVGRVNFEIDETDHIRNVYCG